MKHSIMFRYYFVKILVPSPKISDESKEMKHNSEKFRERTGKNRPLVLLLFMRRNPYFRTNQEFYSVHRLTRLLNGKIKFIYRAGA